MTSVTMIAGTGTNNDVGHTLADWTNPGNITADDGNCALNGYTYGGPGAYLNASNFGFSIPTGASINGIIVNYHKYKSTPFGINGNIEDYLIQLIINGNNSGNNYANIGTFWSTSTSNIDSYGGSSDLWGLSLAPSDINSSSFGVSLQATASTSLTNCYANIDSCFNYSIL